MVDIAHLTAIVDSEGIEYTDAALENLARSATGARMSTESLTKSSQKSGASMGRMGGVYTKLGGNTRQLRGTMQNLSWQMQDVIVQMEMGVPIFRILSQQVPQMTVGMGMWATIIGTVAGGIFALFSVIFRGEKDVRNLTTATDNLTSSMTAFETAFSKSNDTLGTFNDEIGYIDQKMSGLLATLSAFAEKQVLSDMAEQFRLMQQETGLLLSRDFAGQGFASFFDTGYFFDRDARDDMDAMATMFSHLNDETTDAKHRLEDLNKLLDLFTKYTDGKTLTDEQEEYNKFLAESIVLTTKHIGVSREVAAAAKKQVDNREMLVKLHEEAAALELANLDKITASYDAEALSWYKFYENKNRIIRETNQVEWDGRVAIQDGWYSFYAEQRQAGKIRNQMEETHARLAVQNVLQQIAKAKKLADERKVNEETYSRFVIQNVLQRYAMEKAEADALFQMNMANNYILYGLVQTESQNLADTLYDAWENGASLASLDLQYGINTAAIVAGKLATELGISLTHAVAIVNLSKGSVLGGRGGDPRSFEDDEFWNSKYFPDPEKYKKDKKGSGPTALERMLEEQRQREVLLGLMGDERTLQQEIFKIEQSLGDERNNLSSEFIENLALQNLALTEQEKALQEIMDNTQSLADTIESAMSDSLMSIVDGTKTVQEAFRSMAYEIIKELYSILVVQQIVGSWDSSSGSGSGILGILMGAITGGISSGGMTTPLRRPTTFAGGGYTGNGSRTGGMDGQGGFLAMLHPQETVTDHTQQGGGSGTTVVQNITVNAMGDGDIDRVLSKRMPQMKNMVMIAINNERRRGAF